MTFPGFKGSKVTSRCKVEKPIADDTEDNLPQSEPSGTIQNDATETNNVNVRKPSDVRRRTTPPTNENLKIVPNDIKMSEDSQEEVLSSVKDEELSHEDYLPNNHRMQYNNNYSPSEMDNRANVGYGTYNQQEPHYAQDMQGQHLEGGQMRESLGTSDDSNIVYQDVSHSKCIEQ